MDFLCKVAGRVRLSFFFGSASPRRGGLRRLSACIRVTSVLLLALPHWAVAQNSRVLVGNLGQSNTSNTTNLATHDVYQPFVTGANLEGYTVTSVQLGLGAVPSQGSVPALSIWTSSMGYPGEKVGDLTAPATLSASAANTWTTDGIRLKPRKFYVVRVDSDGTGTSSTGNLLRQSNTNNRDSSSLADWIIVGRYFDRNADGSGSWNQRLRTLKFAINSRANPAVPPKLVSIARKRPSSSTNADRLVWRVTFSKPVRNVDATDFTVRGTTAALAVSGGGRTYDVTLSGGDLAILEGTVTLGLASGQNIQDADGRALTSTVPNGANDNSYVVDNTGPTILHIRPKSDMQNGSNASIIKWWLTFSEPVKNLRATDIYIAEQGKWNIRMSGTVMVRRLTGAVYEISAENRDYGDDRAYLLGLAGGASHNNDHDHNAEDHDHSSSYTAHVVNQRVNGTNTNIRDMAGNPLATELQTPLVGADRVNARPAFETVPLNVDMDPPVLFLAVVNGDTITLQYYHFDIDPSSVPAADAFTAKADGTAVALAEDTPVHVTNSRVTLTLASPVASSQTVTLDYTAPDIDPIRDRAGNNAADLVDISVIQVNWVAPHRRVPVAEDSAVTATEDTAHSFTRENFTYNVQEVGRPVPGRLVSVHIASLPSAGTGSLTLDGTAIEATDLPKTVTRAELDVGKLKYTPPANANGDEYASFTFKVSNPTLESESEYIMTINVTAVNDAATGAPTISGTASEGETLTADVSGIADEADGLTKAANGDAGHAFAYEWLRVGRDTETVIEGATASTYRLTAADAVKKFKVRVSFTDDDGHQETLTSAIFLSNGSVAGNAAPTAANGEVTATEDTTYAVTASDFGFADSDSGDVLASVKITALPASGTGMLSVDGAAIAAADLPKTVTSTELGEGKLEYTPPANANGDAYATFSFKVNDGASDSALAYTMTIDVTAVNDAATGLPTISGAAREGETLTADVSGLADAVDGLPKTGSGDAGHAFAYEWLRVDGETETVIADEAASTYELAAADVGKKIKVRVTFTDDDGHAETLTGAAWPSSGSVAAGLTASFENIPPRHDGETQFNLNLRFSRKIERLSYLWLRDHLLSAIGARVVSASRENPPDNQGWLITLAPTGTGDVTLRLPALACDAQYAVCAGGAPLAGPASVTIPYAAEQSEPAAVETFGTTFVSRSHQHGGAGGAARFYVYFQTEPHGLSFRNVAARAEHQRRHGE